MRRGRRRVRGAVGLALLAAIVAPDAAARQLEASSAARPVHDVRLTVLASGDLLVHAPVAASAATARGYDFRPLLAPIRPLVRRADIALCHAETPIGAGARSGYPLFNAPAELARALRWSGFDACSTASNHSLDRGAAGIGSTLHALRRAGVRATGTARSHREARRILLLRRRGVDVALLSYTYGTNGLPLPAPWTVNVIHPPRIRADARRARRLGADVVLVNLHWGAEYVHRPTDEQRRVARAVLRGGRVDAIVGQHAHVVQPIRRVRGRFVVFGEGNLLSAQDAACCAAAAQDGLLALLRIRVRAGKARVTRVDYAPIRVSRPGHVVEPVGPRLRALRRAGEAESPLARELRASWRRTVSVAGRTRFVRPLRRHARG
jgi:poly-gamma-glutamate capsule biosynthesis protein CapA/YwtB (metallophosphatase superfamily)